jgi:molybdopterin-containing oxidoreductase family iron-sulfur binding subunit
MRYGMVIDLKKCIGCYGCQIFCRAENATPPGGAWSGVLFYELGKYPNIRKMPLPVLCMHCEKPACVDVCPTGASRKRADGIVTIDRKKCTGCLNCLLVCPYGARHMYPKKTEYFPGQGQTPYEKASKRKHKAGTVEKCDFCLSRVEEGLKPACIGNCMAKARYFGDLDDPDSEVSKLIGERKCFRVEPTVEPGTGKDPDLHPSVYYLLP